jgi:hypothetical protein
VKRHGLRSSDGPRDRIGDHVGTAPDLGAYEASAPLPGYGAR